MSDDRFEKWSAAIGTSSEGTVAAAEGQGCSRTLGAKLREICTGRMTDDVKTPWEGRREVNADAKDPACDEPQEERSRQ